MKGFFTTFLICFFGILIFLFFGSYLTGGLLFEFLFENIFGMVTAVALPMAIVIEGAIHLEEKIDRLQKRLDALEGKAEAETEKEEKEDETADIDG